MGLGQAQGTMEAALQVIRRLPVIWPQSPRFHHFQGLCPRPVLSWGSIFLSGQGVAWPPCSALGIVDPDAKEQLCSCLVPTVSLGRVPAGLVAWRVLWWRPRGWVGAGLRVQRSWAGVCPPGTV